MKEIYFNWPTNQNIELDKQLKLLKSLISYSTNLDKLDIFTKEGTIKSLDEHIEAQQLINDFNSKNTIPSEKINKYRLFFKSQLMNDLIQNNLIEYFDTQNIITFINQFKDPYKSIESYWMIKAQKLSQEYLSDFCISIPDFKPTDIIFLLVNPMTKEKGFILEEIQFPDQLFNDLSEISDHISSFDQIRIEIFELIKKYVKQNYPKEFDKFLKSKLDNFDNFLSQIVEKKFLPNDIIKSLTIIHKIINIGSKIPSKTTYESLDFSDFEDLNLLDFNLYLDKYPIQGFYISQFPEIKTHMNNVYQFWGNKKDKFPLSLLEFRILCKFHKIRFQQPTTASNESFNDIQNIISRELETIITKEDMHFSHFIEFLLPKIPSFITKKFYSDYIRDILLSLLRVPEDKTIQQYIIVFLKEFIPKILNKVGCSDWENLINEELKYESKDEFICFLTNPWKFVLEQIDETIRPGYSMNLNAAKDVYLKMKTMINSITTEKSIKELNKCVIEDIEFIKDKLIQDYNIAKNSIVTNQDVLDKWSIYSQQVSSFISFISPLPSMSMANSSPPLLPGQSFDEFYNFFSQNLSSFSNNETRIIAFLPKKSNSNNLHKLQYFYNGKKVEIHFKIEGKVMLFSIPYDVQIESLKMVSTSLVYKVLKIKYNHFKSKLSPSITGIIRSYKQFNEFNNRLSSNSLRVDDCNRIQNEINNADVVFGKFNVNEFIEKLNQLKSNLPDSFKNINELNDVTENLKNELLFLTNIHFSNNEISKPPNTFNFLNRYLKSDDLLDSIDLNSFMNFLECFPSYNNIYSELDQLLYKCNLFSLKPKNVEKIDFDKKIEKIELSNNLLSPVIFKEGNILKSTAKSIEIYCDSLIFGVDLLPLQIRICNFADEELICQFEQENEELSPPIWKNDNGFLIIEIPVEKICRNDSNEEKSFIFKGKILISTKYYSCISTKIDYLIKLNYISSDSKVLGSNSFEIKINNNNNNLESNLVTFPNKISITSFYQKFNEILNLILLLPSNIYELTKSNDNNDQIQLLLNQLQVIYSWQKESSTCFPFYSLKTKFNEVLSSTLNKLHKSKINLSNFTYVKPLHNIILYFVQLPKLQFNETEEVDDELNENFKEKFEEK